MLKQKESRWSLKSPLFLTKKDKRYSKHLKQLKRRGFSDSETWSLDCVIAEFILPRLIRFKEVNNGYPHDLTEEKWAAILDKMIYSFSRTVSGDDNPVEFKKVQEGLDLFAKYFKSLWW